MAITLEDIQKAKTARNSKKLGISLADIEKAKEARGQQQLDQVRQESPFLSKVAETTMQYPKLANAINWLGDKAKTGREAIEGLGLPEAAGGFLEGFGNVPISIFNIPPALQEYAGKEASYRVPYLNLEQYLPEEKQGSMAFSGGHLAGSMLGTAATGRLGLDKLMPSEALTPEMLKNALAMWAVGENKEGGGRETSAAIGAAIPALVKAIQAIPKGIKKAGNLRYKKIGEKFLETERAQRAKYGNKFEDLIKEGEEVIRKGKKAASIPRTNVYKGINAKAAKTTDAFYAKPTIREAHKAQSSLGKIAQQIKGDTAPDVNLRYMLREDQEALRNFIGKSLQKNKAGKLYDKYQGLREAWKDRVVPFGQLKDVAKAKSKNPHEYITPTTLGKRLTGKEGVTTKGAAPVIKEKVPEAAQRKLANTIAKFLGGGSGAYTLKKLFSD